MVIRESEKPRFINAENSQTNERFGIKRRGDRNALGAVIYLSAFIGNPQLQAFTPAAPSHPTFAVESDLSRSQPQLAFGSQSFLSGFGERNGELVVPLFCSAPLPSRKAEPHDERGRNTESGGKGHLVSLNEFLKAIELARRTGDHGFVIQMPLDIACQAVGRFVAPR